MNLKYGSLCMFYGSTWHFLLESYTPDLGWYRSVFVSMYYSMTFYADDVLPCTMAWRPQNKADSIQHEKQYTQVYSSTHRYRVVHISMYWYVLVCTCMDSCIQYIPLIGASVARDTGFRGSPPRRCHAATFCRPCTHGGWGSPSLSRRRGIF